MRRRLLAEFKQKDRMLGCQDVGCCKAARKEAESVEVQSNTMTCLSSLPASCCLSSHSASPPKLRASLVRWVSTHFTLKWEQQRDVGLPLFPTYYAAHLRPPIFFFFFLNRPSANNPKHKVICIKCAVWEWMASRFCEGCQDWRRMELHLGCDSLNPPLRWCGTRCSGAAHAG